MPKIIDDTGLDLSIQDILSLMYAEPEADQGSEAWHEQRLGKATASMFQIITLRDRSDKPYKAYYDYMLELVTERLTGKAKRFSTKPMQHGTEYEAAAASTYEDFTGADVREVGFLEHPTLAAGASPDRLVDDDGQLEIKAPNTGTFIRYLLSTIPQSSDDITVADAAGVRGREWLQYFEQMQGQLWITGRRWCDFVVYDPDLPENCQMIIKRVERDDTFINDVLEPRITEFLGKVDMVERYVRNYNYMEGKS